MFTVNNKPFFSLGRTGAEFQRVQRRRVGAGVPGGQGRPRQHAGDSRLLGAGGAGRRPLRLRQCRRADRPRPRVRRQAGAALVRHVEKRQYGATSRPGSRRNRSASSASSRPPATRSGCCRRTVKLRGRRIARAFVALCAHLKAVDSTEHTVIALADRERTGHPGQRPRLRSRSASHVRKCRARTIWSRRCRPKARAGFMSCGRQQAARPAGRGPSCSAGTAGEVMTAWSIATYIDHIAVAGKADLRHPDVRQRVAGRSRMGHRRGDLPLRRRGGQDAGHLQVVRAPHRPDRARHLYRAIRGATRPSARPTPATTIRSSCPNPRRAAPTPGYMFRAIADYGAIGYHHFATEQVLDADGVTDPPEAQMLVDSFRCVAAIAPLLLKYRGTGRVHAVVQEENLRDQRLDLDRLRRPGGVRRAAAHGLAAQRGGKASRREPGARIGDPSGPARILPGRRELPPAPAAQVAAGDQPRYGAFAGFPAHAYDAVRQCRRGPFRRRTALCVPDRRRNGDEICHGVWVSPDRRCGARGDVPRRGTVRERGKVKYHNSLTFWPQPTASVPTSTARR